jgi:hypothetical protein
MKDRSLFHAQSSLQAALRELNGEARENIGVAVSSIEPPTEFSHNRTKPTFFSSLQATL